MPKKNQWSQQAKAQRASGKRGFDDGLTEDNPFEKIFDPDFEPDFSAGRDDQVDSDDDVTPSGYTFSMTNENSGGEEMDAEESEVELSSEEEDFEEELAKAIIPDEDPTHVSSQIHDSAMSLTYFL